MSTYPAPVIPLTVAPPAAAGIISSSQVKNNSTPAAAQTNGSSQSFAQDHWNRYAHLKGVDDSKNALIEDILSRYDAVVRQFQNPIDEQNAQNCCSNGSNHDSALQERQAAYIDHLQSLMDANPFVVVVVDGNNFLFNDALVRDGEKGGRSAAVVLKDELSEWVSKSVEHAPSDPKILIKVYADFKSVAGTFAKGGVIENMSTFGEFARGFNTLFDFVDIGVGDVNSKIIDHLKLFLHDYHCHQVIFGGASQLLETNVPQGDMLRKRVALLQSVSTNVEIPFKTVFFTEVFRTSKSITSTATTTPRTGTPGSLLENGSGNRPLPQSRNDSRASSISTTNNPVAIANVPVAKSWAKRAQEVAPLPQTSEIPRAVEMPIRRHNKKGQRIDPPFNFDWDELKRVKKIKMCNMNYLHPNGCKWSAERCNHLHDYPATEAEIEILKSVSRETACHNGVTCDDLICVYGHRCPYPPSTEGSMRGLGCYLGEKCRFPREMHGIKDSTPARTTKLGKF